MYVDCRPQNLLGSSIQTLCAINEAHGSGSFGSWLFVLVNFLLSYNTIFRFKSTLITMAAQCSGSFGKSSFYPSMVYKLHGSLACRLWGPSSFKCCIILSVNSASNSLGVWSLCNFSCIL